MCQYLWLPARRRWGGSGAGLCCCLPIPLSLFQLICIQLLEAIEATNNFSELLKPLLNFLYGAGLAWKQWYIPWSAHGWPEEQPESRRKIAPSVSPPCPRRQGWLWWRAKPTSCVGHPLATVNFGISPHESLNTTGGEGARRAPEGTTSIIIIIIIEPVLVNAGKRPFLTFSIYICR